MLVAPILHQHGPSYGVCGEHAYLWSEVKVYKQGFTSGPLGMTGIALWQRVFLAYMVGPACVKVNQEAEQEALKT